MAENFNNNNDNVHEAPQVGEDVGAGNPADRRLARARRLLDRGGQPNGLDLGRVNLTAVPAAVMELTSLVRLSLKVNEISDVPPEISRLQQLTEIKLHGNHIERLPQEIGTLPELKKLWLGFSVDVDQGNLLTDLPGSMSRLTSLWWLNLSHNLFTTVPEVVPRITSLRKLYLKGNRFSGPLTGAISSLVSLQTLTLSHMDVTRLPPTISRLTALMYLNIGENRIRALPWAFGGLVSLERCFMEGNPLTLLPATVTNLTQLRELGVDPGLPLLEGSVWPRKGNNALRAALAEHVAIGTRLNAEYVVVMVMLSMGDTWRLPTLW